MVRFSGWENQAGVSSAAMATAPERATEFSLVRGDAFIRIQRAVGLVPADGLGIGRRALFFAALTWLPMVGWAFWQGRALPGEVPDPLLRHFGVHVRCLVAIPLFVLAEGLAHSQIARLLPEFFRSKLVDEIQRDRFNAALNGVAGLRDAGLPWATILAVVLAWTILLPNPSGDHQVAWAGGGFGAWWFYYVVNPIYLAFLLGWIWRLALAGWLFARLRRIPMRFTPTHPDRVGGLGFLERVPAIFSPVILGVSIVVAARLVHDVLYHDVSATSLRYQMIFLVVLLSLIFLAPLLVWNRPLRAAKALALREYGELVAAHRRIARRRWGAADGLPDDPEFDPSGLGSMGDTVALHTAAQKMRGTLLSPTSVATVLLPAALPMLAVLSLEIPVKDTVVKLLKLLV